MQKSYSLQDLPQIPGARIIIIQSRWHSEYTDLMPAKCLEVLKAADCPKVEIYQVPGAMEIPIIAQTLIRAKKGAVDCIIAFGSILKGETDHYQIVMNESSRGLTEVSLKENIPIINEIIPALNLKQIIARTSDDEYNKGYEGGLAAIDVIYLRRQIAMAMK